MSESLIYSLLAAIHARTHARFPVLKKLSSVDGQCHAGIYLVEDAYHPGTRYIKKKFSRKDVMSGMALREISALDQLDHANINKLVAYDIDMANQVGAAFLELCDLGNLADLIKRHRKAKRPIPEGFVWHVFIALVDALRYMQKGPFGMTDVALWNEIYHRDISPENVFLATASSEDAYPRVVLGDFGCSASRIDVECRLTSGRRVERQNPEFEPPEAPFYNSQSDIYTVALMVVCMCRLKPDRWPIPERVDEQWVLGQGYSAELNALVRRCLQGRLASRIGIQDLWNMTNASRLKSTGDGSQLILT